MWMLIILLSRPLSTVLKMCYASLSHSVGASTLPWRVHLVNLNFSCPSIFSISRSKAAAIAEQSSPGCAPTCSCFQPSGSYSRQAQHHTCREPSTFRKLLIGSSTTESSDPLTFDSAILALTLDTNSTVISAMRPSSVKCWSPAISRPFVWLKIGSRLAQAPLESLICMFA